MGVLGQREGGTLLNVGVGVQPDGTDRRSGPRSPATAAVDPRPEEILTPSLRARFVSLLLPPRPPEWLARDRWRYAPGGHAAVGARHAPGQRQDVQDGLGV